MENPPGVDHLSYSDSETLDNQCIAYSAKPQGGFRWHRFPPEMICNHGPKDAE